MSVDNGKIKDFEVFIQRILVLLVILFKILKQASIAVFEKLRYDESSLDLKDQFSEKVEGGNYKYFLDPYLRKWKYPVVFNCIECLDSY